MEYAQGDYSSTRLLPTPEEGDVENFLRFGVNNPLPFPERYTVTLPAPPGTWEVAGASSWRDTVSYELHAVVTLNPFSLLSWHALTLSTTGAPLACAQGWRCQDA